jgi:stage III sporulation protein SpoIIIAA
MVLALFILFCFVRGAAVTTSTTRVFRVVVGTSGTLTHLVAQRCASKATCNGAKRPQNGTRGSASNTTGNGSYSFTSVNASRVGLVATSSTVLIAVVVFSHPSHSLVL